MPSERVNLTSDAGSSSGGGSRRGPNLRNNVGLKRRKDGCLTCRRRRVGCGRERPSCERCKRLKLNCDWAENHGDSSREDAPISGGGINLSSTLTSPSHSVSQSSNADGPISVQSATLQHLTPYSFGAAFPPNPPPVLNTLQTNNQYVDYPFNSNAPSLAQGESFDLEFFSGLLGAEGTWDGGSGFSNDLTFDLLGSFNNITSPENLITRAPTFPQTIVSAVNTRSLRTPVNLELDHLPLISHYLNKISQAAKVRDSSLPNHYLVLFATGLFYPPLYTGILAWSALHLASTLPISSTRQSQLIQYSKTKHADSADLLSASVAETLCTPVTEADREALLSAIVTYCQYEIALGTNQSLQYMLNSAQHLLNRENETRYTPLTQRIAAILCSFDVRSSMFGLGSAEYTTALTTPLFGSVEDPSPTQSPAASNWHVGSLDLLHVNHLQAGCCRIDRNLRASRVEGNTDKVREVLRKADGLFNIVQGLRDRFDGSNLDYLSSAIWNSTSSQPLSDVTISKAFIASLYNSLVIYLARILNIPPPPRTYQRIINVAYNLHLAFPDVSQSLFPRPAFFAALETRDQEHYNWIVDRLCQLAQTGWGENNQKTKDLLLEVRRLEAQGARQDIGALMITQGLSFIM